MTEDQNASKKKSLVLKIILPVVIVAVIAGIWLIKANEKGAVIPEPSASAQSAIETPQATENLDFLLPAIKVDLEQLKSYGLPIIIDFGSDSCIPCKEMAPVLEKLHEEWQGKVIVKFVDVWKFPDASEGFPVQLIPTQFFFDDQGNPYVPSDPEGMGMQMYTAEGTGDHILTAHQGGLTEEQFRAIFKEMGVE